jgi:hypothetical protein
MDFKAHKFIKCNMYHYHLVVPMCGGCCRKDVKWLLCIQRFYCTNSHKSEGQQFVPTPLENHTYLCFRLAPQNQPSVWMSVHCTIRSLWSRHYNATCCHVCPLKKCYVIFMHPNHSLIHETGQNHSSSIQLQLVSKSQFSQKNSQRITLTIGCVAL